ncbi:hypothetical protein [Flavobacterium quisquiliarum]|uniref:Uncharacterized protein n=1 Tax=Flavobacterium quisquiliarum TaxID=1834436 RepID=A0ABV8VYU2_9FLAO|nr:hypothetical protein [Flavobacterium quisquiliarum]MBW1655819.1 hypothetical protein [Flavobacterium quisquiliarum]NWL01434.1 hypothetical protein [Flavobacterium collinsii]
MARLDETHKMPIFQKAEQILKLTEGLVHIIPAENEFLQETTVRFMLENAMIIPAKIAGAEAGDLYDLRMENAAIIRKAARELYVQAGSLRYEDGITDTDYIYLLRDTIEEFRFLFIDWVAGFDVWNYIKDSWGLFNPPGVNAHDKDPDEDIPFNPNDFFNSDDDDDDL